MQLENINQSETSVEEYVDRTVITTRFGIMKLIGDKQEHEISWSAYQKLKNMPADFSGLLEIKELGIMVPVNQITMLASGERSETQFKAFTSLPAERIELDIDFNIIHGLKRQIEGKYDKYYSAVCHYNEKDGKKKYILEKEKIKELDLMKKDADEYDFCISGIWRYGRKVL